MTERKKLAKVRRELNDSIKVSGGPRLTLTLDLVKIGKLPMPRRRRVVFMVAQMLNVPRIV